MSDTATEVALWLFVIVLGTTVGMGVYEHRIVMPRWISPSVSGDGPRNETCPRAASAASGRFRSSGCSRSLADRDNPRGGGGADDRQIQSALLDPMNWRSASATGSIARSSRSIRRSSLLLETKALRQLLGETRPLANIHGQVRADGMGIAAEIDLRPILERLATKPLLDVAVSDETDAELPRIAGGMSVGLVRTFKILEPQVHRRALDNGRTRPRDPPGRASA